MTSIYEYQLDTFVRVAKRFMRKHIVRIVELGARDCTETCAFASLFPDAEILTFECNPDTLPLCRERITNFKNITLIEKAVSDTEGVMSFQKTAKESEEGWNPGSSSLLKINADIVKDIHQTEISVPVTTLNYELSERNIHEVDLLWMDIQGSELAALKGAGPILQTISLIHCEVEFAEMYVGQPLFADIQTFLDEHGFALLTFSSISKLSGDAIFIRKSLYTPILPSWLIVAAFTLKEKVSGKIRVVRQKFLSRRS